MGLKMKNVDIMGAHQFLAEGGRSQKNIYMGNCLKIRAGEICWGLGKK